MVLARSESAIGPYTFMREVFPVFAHEPTAGRGPNGEYVVWFTRYQHLNSTGPCLGICGDGTCCTRSVVGLCSHRAALCCPASTQWQHARRRR